MRIVPGVSANGIGVIGIDINVDHLAITETDRFGNPMEYDSIPCVTYGKSSKQRLTIIGDAVRKVMAFAVNKQKPRPFTKLHGYLLCYIGIY